MNGVLVNFAPMQAMSSYFKDKNLNMVRFDTLRNTLLFKNGTLFIPDMNINSSLGYMEIAGKAVDGHANGIQYAHPAQDGHAGWVSICCSAKRRRKWIPTRWMPSNTMDKEKKIRFMNIKITGTPDDYKVHLGKPKKSGTGHFI